MRFCESAMFQRIADRSLQCPKWRGSTGQVCCTRAVLNYHNDVLLNELARELPSREGHSPECIANLARACACLDVLKLKEVNQCFAKPSKDYVRRKQRNEISLKEMSQFAEVKLAWQQIQRHLGIKRFQ